MIYFREVINAPVAQWIERLVAVQKVVSPILAGRTKKTPKGVFAFYLVFQ